MSALPGDYDHDPDRFAANEEATRRLVAGGDLHERFAQRFAAAGCRSVLDVGGGTGALARRLRAVSVGSVVVDRAGHLVRAPRPVVRGDARRLPFASESFDGAAALWMLYHLSDPLVALREVRRVLRPGGWFAVCTSGRHNDPELAGVLPGWGRPSTFDAEDAVDLVAQVLEVVDVVRWDAPLAAIPDRAALALFLRGRGLSEVDAVAAAARLEVPMTVTKRGMLAWARRPTSG